MGWVMVMMIEPILSTCGWSCESTCGWSWRFELDDFNRMKSHRYYNVYGQVWKKEFSPSEGELAALRRGEDWDPVREEWGWVEWSEVVCEREE